MHPDRSLQVKSGDVRLAVNLYGAEQQSTLILVHGYPDCSDVWSQLLAPLSQRFRVVTYDVRGAGQSSVPATTKDYALEKLAADFRAVLDAVSPDQPVHLVAHDWGSIQSWESVTDPQLRSLLKSFTTISGPCFDHVGFWMHDAIRSRSLAELRAVAGQMVSSWYIWMFQLPLVAPLLWKTLLGKHWHRMLARSQGVIAEPTATQEKDGVNGIGLYRANILRLLRPQQRFTSVPVQQIIPVNDDFVTPDLVRQCAQPWVEKLWSREVEAGHWMPLSHPQLLAQMIVEFADCIDGGEESAALQRARCQQKRA